MDEMRPFVFVIGSADSGWAFLGLCNQVPDTSGAAEFEHVFSIPPPELGLYQLHELVVFARVGFVGSPAPPVRRVLATPLESLDPRLKPERLQLCEELRAAGEA